MRCLRPLLLVLLTLAFFPAAAQQPAENPPARPAASVADELPVNLSALAALDCDPAQVVRTLTRSLQLQPYQALVLRRALLASPDPAADATELPAAETLRLVLSQPQLTQLQQVLATPPAVLTNWVALSR